ncbi:hypothetical protein TKK_0002123 [Trichogramma kaykai]|uniref:Lysosomal-trafficking regulator n=1 Tax=Trichogramma kaykai TaxID=54128 RepID=A0ABD2XC14_9HYME
MSSTAAQDKLYTYWLEFIGAELLSKEKSNWLDAFLAELISRVAEGQDLSVHLTFCSSGEGTVATLVCCELLSDVHALCQQKADQRQNDPEKEQQHSSELDALRDYIARDRGWRCLAALLLMDLRQLSCAKELVGLLLAFYPLLGQLEAKDRGKNPYVKLNKLASANYQRNRDDRLDEEEIGNGINEQGTTIGTNNYDEAGQQQQQQSAVQRRRRRRQKPDHGKRQSLDEERIEAAQTAQQRRSNVGSARRRRSTIHEVVAAQGSSSDEAGSGDARVPSPTLSSLLPNAVQSMNIDDYDNPINGMMIGQDEPLESPKLEELLDERARAVLEAPGLGRYEASLLTLQLLLALQDQRPGGAEAQKVVGFALDALWTLQYSNANNATAKNDDDENSESFTRLENASLRACTARLLLRALERALESPETPGRLVVHRGLLPMSLRLLEDVCARPVKDASAEEAVLLQESVFATLHAVVALLQGLVRAGGSRDFPELFRLTAESQNPDRRIIERAVLAGLELAPQRGLARACRFAEALGNLVTAMKRARKRSSPTGTGNGRPGRRSGAAAAGTQSSSRYQPGLAHCTEYSNGGGSCCVASIFGALADLLRRSVRFGHELQIRVLEVMNRCGACCCLASRPLLDNVVSFLERTSSTTQWTYDLALDLLEQTLFHELGGSTMREGSCECYSEPRLWDCLELYTRLLKPANPKLCHCAVRHLLKQVPQGTVTVRRELLFRVFYPSFLEAKKSSAVIGDSSSSAPASKFLIQSCLSAMASLLNDPKKEYPCDVYIRFVKLDGLKQALDLLPTQSFVKGVYALLEVACIMEIEYVEQQVWDTPPPRTATRALFDALERETRCLCETTIGPANESSEPSVGSENSSNVNKQKLSYHHASAAWRAAAGVASCSPRFQAEFQAEESIVMNAYILAEKIAVAIATDRFEDGTKFALRVLEAIVTVFVVSSLTNDEPNMISVLSQALMNDEVKLGRGIGTLVELLLQVSMLSPNPDVDAVSQQTRHRHLSAMDISMDWADGEDSSAGEYLTADDGYDADVEVPVKTDYELSVKKQNRFGRASDSVRGSVNADPAVCSLAIDLLIYYANKELNEDRAETITNGLKKLAIVCKESPKTCATLSGQGNITKLFEGFEHVLKSNDSDLTELQHAVLEIFTSLAMQLISPTELVSFLAFFKNYSPPLTALLMSLHRLVLAAEPQPNFILQFPAPINNQQITAIGPNGICLNRQSSNEDVNKSMERAETLVNTFRKKHLAADICTPWSVHAICLPIGQESSWSVWCQGCSASLWLRVERGASALASTNSSNNNIGGKGLHIMSDVSPLLDSDSDSLSDWGLLSDNWSRDVAFGCPTISVLHLLSIGFESLVLESWLDLKSDTLILRLTRPDDKTNRTISEISINGVLPAGNWHHLAMNVKDTVLNKHSAVVEVVLWIDGWKEITAQLPFDGLLIRKPGTTCILVGQMGPSAVGAWYMSNLMIFRAPVFNSDRALALASLGPNYTNMADCMLSNYKPDFASIICSGALHGIQKPHKNGSPEWNKSKISNGGGVTQRNDIEVKVSCAKIDWESVMDSTNTHLAELQDNLLVCYEAQTPGIMHLYPQGVTNVNLMKNLFPGQPGFKVLSLPEHRVSQQPPLSIAPILASPLQSQSYKGLVSAASLIGGMPIFLYLFARVVELNSTEEEQALALSVVLNLARSDSEMLSQYRSEGGPSLLLRVLESSRCYASKYMLKAVMDAVCDCPIIVKDTATNNHLVSQNSESVITDPELLKCTLEAWRTWATYDSLNLLLQALLQLLKDQHSQREFNASQMNRIRIVETLLSMCKEYFLYDDACDALDATTGSAVVELVRSLMGAPPEFAHLVQITDFLVLAHQASETYVTHSRHNMYFLLPPLPPQEASHKSTNRLSSLALNSVSQESLGLVENIKLTKALTNVEIQRGSRLKNGKATEAKEDGETSSQGQDTSAGEDSGIAASEGSNKKSPQQGVANQDTPQLAASAAASSGESTASERHSASRRACQGVVCEGLLLLLRDALRVLPDSQVSPVMRHVLRAELLLVLANDPDARVRTALVKLVQVYLQRAGDEQLNKFIKQRYFVHLANQVALYPGSEPLVVTLENLALKGPSLAAVPPVLAMIPRAAASDMNVARPLVTFVTDLITKNPNSLRTLLEQGLMETLGRGIVNAAHSGFSVSLFRDMHVLLVSIAGRLLDSPGSQHMQAVAELHQILNQLELGERSRCEPAALCVAMLRDAQVALFDGELDVLAAKVSNQSGFRLKSAASYLASSSTNLGSSGNGHGPMAGNNFTASSELSDHPVSRSSSYASLYGAAVAASNNKEPGKGEINERFRICLNRAVDFLTAADEGPSASELQLSKRLFAILLHGVANPLGKKTYWLNAWSVKPALRKNTARIMVWLMSPHQNMASRVYAVRALMDEPKAREILRSLIEVGPQIEHKFSVFLWDLLQRADEMPSADARICEELSEAVKVWELAKSFSPLDQNNIEAWSEELSLIRRELVKDREIWVDAQLPAIQRLTNRFESLAKQLTESAMSITRLVVEEQNRERKVMMERLKQARSAEAQGMAKWRDLARRLTHERGPWHFPESYPCSWELDPTEGPARVRIRLQRCHLNIDRRFFLPEQEDKVERAKVEAPLSYLFTSVKQDANATALIERLHTSERIRRMSQVRVVTPQAELPGEALIGETCFYFVPDNPDVPLHTDIALGGLDLAMVGGMAWRLEDIRELHRRRYQLQERAIEIFLITGRTYLLAFDSSKERDDFAAELSACELPRRIPGDDLGEALTLWRSGALTNWEYITCLNKLAGRSYNDLMQYPVFPFVLAEYTADKINLDDPSIYRNFKRPMAVQDKKNEQHYINNYNYLKQALSEGLNLIALNQEPFHYGSHYSNSGTVLHFLVRLPPFTSMFLTYQDDNFDIPDRTFHALATTWRLTSCDSTTDVKELIPEFFYLPEFLLNFEGFNFGVRQNGNRVGDVELPKWCGGDARLFVLAHRAALESEIVREVLPFWIDLVFGFRQTGRPAVEAINVFHPATYYGFNVEQIADPLERQAWETMIKTYGQTPAQLFRASHPLPITSLGSANPSNIPPVIEGVEGIRWGTYVGAPGNDPVMCWKHKPVLLASLVPLITGDVFGLPVFTTLILAYSKDKGTSMLNNTSVMGAALISWNSTDGIARLKTKKEQPPKPLIKAVGLDSITLMKSSPDCEQLWIGYASGRILVYACTVSNSGKIDFNGSAPSVLLGHRNQVTAIDLSRAFSVAVSGDSTGVLVLWDLNSLTYIRSVICDGCHPISMTSISETLGDIAVVYQMSNLVSDGSSTTTTDIRSSLKVYTINTRLIGSVSSRRKITALCYSNAVEGVSVNVIATGLDNGMIRLWSSWDLRLVREISTGVKGTGGIVAITWSSDQNHLYAATEDCTVFIWEGARKSDSGTPKFVNLTTL